MTPLGETLRAALPDEEILLADGFDDAFLGLARRCGQPVVAVYSAAKCLEILMQDGMDLEEAREYFDFNVTGAWVGPQTPVFVEEVQDRGGIPGGDL